MMWCHQADYSPKNERAVKLTCMPYREPVIYIYRHHRVDFWSMSWPSHKPHTQAHHTQAAAAVEVSLELISLDSPSSVELFLPWYNVLLPFFDISPISLYGWAMGWRYSNVTNSTVTLICKYVGGTLLVKMNVRECGSVCVCVCVFVCLFVEGAVADLAKSILLQPQRTNRSQFTFRRIVGYSNLEIALELNVSLFIAPRTAGGETRKNIGLWSFPSALSSGMWLRHAH